MDGVDRSRGWTHPYQPPFRGPSHDCYIGFNAVQVHVVDHPLAAARLTTLRDERTDNAGFRAALRELTLLLIYEATRDAPCEPVPIRTPLAETVGSRLTKPPLLVPVLRAGLGMVDDVWSSGHRPNIVAPLNRQDRYTILPAAKSPRRAPFNSR